jgi:hypothetical protein
MPNAAQAKRMRSRGLVRGVEGRAAGQAGGRVSVPYSRRSITMRWVGGRRVVESCWLRGVRNSAAREAKRVGAGAFSRVEHSRAARGSKAARASSFIYFLCTDMCYSIKSTS